MDLYEQYAVVAADEAIKDAGLDGDDIDKNNVGVIFGVGIGGIHTFEEEAGNYAKTGETMGPRYNPFFIPKMIADIASGQVSINHGFRGPNYTTTSACASSTTGRRVQPRAPRQSQRNRGRRSRSSHLAGRRGRLQRNARAVDPQR